MKKKLKYDGYDEIVDPLYKTIQKEALKKIETEVGQRFSPEEVKSSRGRHASAPETLAPPHFVPPTLKEIKAYCQKIHSCISPEWFLKKNQANNWIVQGKPMKNWKLTIQTWDKKERQATVQNFGMPKQKSSAWDMDNPEAML